MKIKTDFSQLPKLVSGFENEEISFDIFMIPLPFAFGVGFDIKEGLQSVNFNSLRDGCEDAIAQAIAKELPRYLDESIESFGVVDTGELKRSLNISVTPSGVEVRYKAPYAAIQHEGGYIRPYGNPNAQKVFLPGRPWVTFALQQAPLKQIAQKACVAYLRSQGL